VIVAIETSGHLHSEARQFLRDQIAVSAPHNPDLEFGNILKTISVSVRTARAARTKLTLDHPQQILSLEVRLQFQLLQHFCPPSRCPIMMLLPHCAAGPLLSLQLLTLSNPLPHPYIHLMLELLFLPHTILLQCCLFTHPLMILFTLDILLSPLLPLSTPLLLLLLLLCLLSTILLLLLPLTVML